MLETEKHSQANQHADDRLEIREKRVTREFAISKRGFVSNDEPLHAALKKPEKPGRHRYVGFFVYPATRRMVLRVGEPGMARSRDEHGIVHRPPVAQCIDKPH